MQIFIHSLDGHQEIVNVAQGLTISQLKEMIIGHSNIQLVCNGMILSSLALLEPYSNVYVSAALEGGKKKKKKKAYTTKKKNKHIHKKVKLHTLSLYGVDNKGAVTYSRKTCPNCGPGIFMGKHWDRYYCGTCHTTIKMDAETIRQNQQILKKKRAALEAQKKAKEKELADKAPAAKGGKKDAKAGKKGKK